MTKSKPIMFAILTATLLISTVSLNEVFASFNDIADINPHCKNGSAPELYVSGNIWPDDDEIFFSWTADPSFYKYTGWFGSCTDYVEFDSLSVRVYQTGPFGWSETFQLGTSASSSGTVSLNEDISDGACIMFSYDIIYSGESMTVYPNNVLNCE